MDRYRRPHVVQGDPRPKVEFFQSQNKDSVAEVRKQEAEDEQRGLALLKVSQNVPENLAVLPLAEQDLGNDEETVVIGFPQGAGPWAAVKASIAARDGRDLTLAGSVDEGNSGVRCSRTDG